MRILVSDDHALIRQGLINVLQQMEEPVEVTEAQDAQSVLEKVQCNESLDVILLDLFMPGANGFELLQRVCDQRPDTPVVVLSASEDIIHMRKALDHGAVGYLPKSSPQEVMLSALRLVLAGGLYVPPKMINPPVDQQQIAHQSAVLDEPVTDIEAYPDNLTNRQTEILKLLGQGKSNKEIARELKLSENTVKIHVRDVLKALGVNNRTKAAMLAAKLGPSKSK